LALGWDVGMPPDQSDLAEGASVGAPEPTNSQAASIFGSVATPAASNPSKTGSALPLTPVVALHSAPQPPPPPKVVPPPSPSGVANSAPANSARIPLPPPPSRRPETADSAAPIPWEAVATESQKFLIDGLPYNGVAHFWGLPSEMFSFLGHLHLHLLKHKHVTCIFTNIEVSHVKITGVSFVTMLLLLQKFGCKMLRLKAFKCNLKDQSAMDLARWLDQQGRENFPVEIHLSHNDFSCAGCDAILKSIEAKNSERPFPLPVWLRINCNRIDRDFLTPFVECGKACLGETTSCGPNKCITRHSRPLVHLRYGLKQNVLMPGTPRAPSKHLLKLGALIGIPEGAQAVAPVGGETMSASLGPTAAQESNMQTACGQVNNEATGASTGPNSEIGSPPQNRQTKWDVSPEDLLGIAVKEAARIKLGHPPAPSATGANTIPIPPVPTTASTETRAQSLDGAGLRGVPVPRLPEGQDRPVAGQVGIMVPQQQQQQQQQPLQPQAQAQPQPKLSPLAPPMPPPPAAAAALVAPSPQQCPTPLSQSHEATQQLPLWQSATPSTQHQDPLTSQAFALQAAVAKSACYKQVFYTYGTNPMTAQGHSKSTSEVPMKAAPATAGPCKGISKSTAAEEPGARTLAQSRVERHRSRSGNRRRGDKRFRSRSRYFTRHQKKKRNSSGSSRRRRSSSSSSSRSQSRSLVKASPEEKRNEAANIKIRVDQLLGGLC